MSKIYKIQSTPIDVLTKQSKVYGFKHTVHILYQELLIIKEKNRSIVFLIKLKKLDALINNYKNYKEKEFYTLFLEGLKQIHLTNLKEYCALLCFLQELVASFR